MKNKELSIDKDNLKFLELVVILFFFFKGMEILIDSVCGNLEFFWIFSLPQLNF
jgi:hypothetical protein